MWVGRRGVGWTPSPKRANLNDQNYTSLLLATAQNAQMDQLVFCRPSPFLLFSKKIKFYITTQHKTISLQKTTEQENYLFCTTGRREAGRWPRPLEAEVRRFPLFLAGQLSTVGLEMGPNQTCKLCLTTEPWHFCRKCPKSMNKFFLANYEKF